MKGPDGVPEVVEETDLTEEMARALMLDRFGARCAAWLVNRFRKTIHRYGAFRVHLPRGATVPFWFGLAIQWLARSKHWETARGGTTATGKSWIVRWTNAPARRGATIFRSPGGDG